jgi:hypothetical protein
MAAVLILLQATNSCILRTDQCQFGKIFVHFVLN